MGIIYCLTSPSGKKYIGQTKRGFDKRFEEHCTKSRPEFYQSSGYVFINHPNLKTKYFTSKKFTDKEKYNMALEYLNSYNMNAVQRLNGNG